MAIKSHAFGRVTLSGADAKKFKNQVTYGRPSAAAAESVRAGMKLVRALEKSGEASVTVKAPRKAIAAG